MTLSRTSKRTYMDELDMLGVINVGRRVAEEQQGTLSGHAHETAAAVFELLLTMDKIDNQSVFWFNMRARYPHLFGDEGGGAL